MARTKQNRKDKSKGKKPAERAAAAKNAAADSAAVNESVAAEEQFGEQDQFASEGSSDSDSDDDGPVNADWAEATSDCSGDESVQVKGLETEPPRVLRSAHNINLYKEPVKTGNATDQMTSIFVGNLPRHFEESQLKMYFSQFGNVLKVRVSRDKESGRPRGYAFVAFPEPEIAHFVANTMNNYLLTGKILKVSVVTDRSLDLYPAKMKSNFREITNWRSQAYEKHNAPKPLAEWKKLEEKFEQRKKDDFAKLKKQGFDYVLEA